ARGKRHRRGRPPGPRDRGQPGARGGARGGHRRYRGPHQRHDPGRGPLSAHAFAGRVAVAGIGATEFSKASGRSELRLATEAVDAALRDAGIPASEVQGMVTYSADTNPDIDIARALGMGELTFFSRVHYGGGAALGVMQQAALAVWSGVADTVVVYRAFNERSGNRF